MAWSLQRQRQTLVAELDGEIPKYLYNTITHKSKRKKSLRQTFFRKGIKNWKELSHLYQLCAELAFKKMQGRRFPEEQGIEFMGK
jgi:hypothetical protein